MGRSFRLHIFLLVLFSVASVSRDEQTACFWETGDVNMNTHQIQQVMATIVVKFNLASGCHTVTSGAALTIHGIQDLKTVRGTRCASATSSSVRTPEQFDGKHCRDPFFWCSFPKHFNHLKNDEYIERASL